jgi:plasmid stability protein
MKNITITLEDEVARWTRIKAAEHEMSVSRYVGQMLREKMRGEAEYEKAMQYFLSRKPSNLKRPKDKYPSRDKLHERENLR